MCFPWSPARLTCLSFAFQQQYAALLPASVRSRTAKDTGKHGLHLDAPPVILAYPVCSSILTYQSSDPTRLSDYISLPIRSALGSPCGVSGLGNCDLTDLRMSA